MQQTEKYQLNLIEKDDVFSLDPLNENMEKVEGALSAATAHADAGDAAVTAAFQAADAALDQRVQVLELHKFAYGSYTGNAEGYGSSQFIELGFTPVAVIVSNLNITTHVLDVALADSPASSVIQIQPGGFKAWYKVTGNSSQSASIKDYKYEYLAFC